MPVTTWSELARLVLLVGSYPAGTVVHGHAEPTYLAGYQLGGALADWASRQLGAVLALFLAWLVVAARGPRRSTTPPVRVA